MTSTTSSLSDNVDLTGAQAVVEWSTPDGQTCYLCSGEGESPEAGPVTFDCHFRPSSCSASFRLRVPILLKGHGRRSTPLFVFLAPERIQSLSHGDFEQSLVPDPARRKLGHGVIVSMQFTLRQPAELVVPPHSPLVPKKKIYWDIFDSLKMLAQETSFVIYLKREEIPSEDSWTSLCDAVSAGRLTTSAAHADISRLFDGKGGKILEGVDLGLPATAPIESPPSYDDAGPPPPAPLIEKDAGHLLSSSSRKRRRTSSTGAGSSTDDVSRHGSGTDTAHVESVCRKLMVEMTAQWREDSNQLRTELHQMETRVKDWVNERLSKHKDDVREEIRRTSVEQQNSVDDQVGEVRLELEGVREETQGADERLDEVKEEVERFRDETSDLVDGRLDERMESLRSELEEHIADQLHEAEDRVIERLRSSVYIDFNIYG